MERRILAAVLAIAVAAPLTAADWTPPKTRTLAVQAQAVGEDSHDMALAALYNRLFALQDKRREAELRIEDAGLHMDEVFKVYRTMDRFVDSVEELKEIADDPEHRQYPNITEKTKLSLLINMRTQMKNERMANLEIAKLERDMSATERMIKDHLQRGAA